MTDIRRHLPGILTCIRDHLASANEDAAALHREVKTALAALLPASYNIASGRLGNAQGNQSQVIDVLIFDTTIPASDQHAQADCYDTRQALVAIMLVPTFDQATLSKTL